MNSDINHERWRFSVGIWAGSPCADRFCTNGYTDKLTILEQIRLAGLVKGLNAIEIQFPSDFEEYGIGEVAKALKDAGLAVSSVNLDSSGARQWRKGAFTAPEARLRQAALDLAKRTADAARLLGSTNVGLWPGQDGFDYPFQSDYRDLWRWEREGIRALAEYAPDLKISLEYKAREPRCFMLIANAATALNLANETGLANVGVTLDFGHALMARENPANAAVMLARQNRLYNLHFNDCYREADDDLMVGTVNLWETAELLYWLKKIGYTHYIGLDIFPYREGFAEACTRSIECLDRLTSTLESMDQEQLAAAMSRMDGAAAVRVCQTAFLSI